MDIADFRPGHQEGDYEATMASGKRGAYSRIESSEVENAVDDESVVVCVETPDPIHPVPYQERTVSDPLSSSDVDRIKSQMQGIKLRHEPSWGKHLSDDEFVHMLRRIVDN